MTRTLVATLLLALLAAPMAIAQHGPPPGYTDPNEYAVDYLGAQADNATADPAGYAQGLDAAAEAEHALWLACWEAHEAAPHALDAACAPFFTAPVTVQADVQAIEAEVTEVLNETGLSGLAGEALDIANDTLADPTSILEQAQRAVGAVIRFVKDLLGFVGDTLGLGLLAIAAGVLGAIQGILDLAALPLEGLDLAGDGLLDLGSAVASILGLIGSGAATASSSAAGAMLDVASALLDAVQATASAAADGVAAVLGAIGAAAVATGQGVLGAGAAVADGVAGTASAAASGIGDGLAAAADGIASAADAVRDGVGDALEKVGSLFDGKGKGSSGGRGGLPDAPKTGTDADGLLDGLLDKL